MAKRRKRLENPLRQFKGERTYKDLAEQLGCSEDLLKKLGSEQIVTLSPQMAMQFEERSRGALKYADLMAWVYDRSRSAA